MNALAFLILSFGDRKRLHFEFRINATPLRRGGNCARREGHERAIFVRKDHADRTTESRVRRAGAAYDLVFDVPAESTRRMGTAIDGKFADLASDKLVAMKERSPLLHASRPQSLREHQTTLDDAGAAPEIARRFGPLRRMLGPLTAHLRRRRGLI